MSNVYVRCHRRRGRPMIALAVCEKRCRHREECGSYRRAKGLTVIPAEAGIQER